MRKHVGPAAVVAGVLVAWAPPALAHPDHGDPTLFDSAFHYLIEPVHLPLTVGVLVALLVVWRVVGTARAAPKRRR
jgi:hypothetical protein